MTWGVDAAATSGPTDLMAVGPRPTCGTGAYAVAMGQSDPDLELTDRWWRAANYLSVGQIYLMANPLLREPLRPEHVKPRLLGPLGHDPGPQPRVRACQPGDRRAGA